MEENKQNPYNFRNDDPARLRDLNKGDFNTLNNFSQTTYDQSEDGKCHKHKNLNLDNYKNYEIDKKDDETDNKDKDKMKIPEKNKNYLTDESLTNKPEKDFERVPDEHERFNKKVNKRINKLEKEKEKEKEEERLFGKTRVFVSDSIEKAKELLAKF